MSYLDLTDPFNQDYSKSNIIAGQHTNNPLFNVLQAYSYFDTELKDGLGVSKIASMILDLLKDDGKLTSSREEEAFYFLVYFMVKLKWREAFC